MSTFGITVATILGVCFVALLAVVLVWRRMRRRRYPDGRRK